MLCRLVDIYPASIFMAKEIFDFPHIACLAFPKRVRMFDVKFSRL
jgi:hypothetical protein